MEALFQESLDSIRLTVTHQNNVLGLLARFGVHDPTIFGCQAVYLGKVLEVRGNNKNHAQCEADEKVA